VRERAVVVDLSGTGVLELAGKDARRFCNGMFTNNVRDLPVSGGHRSALCDAKGKLFGLIDLYGLGERAFRAVLEGLTPEDFEARFGKFIVFDDVEVSDLTALLAVFSVQGSRSAEVLEAAGLPVPTAAWAVADGVGVGRRARCAHGGFDVFAPIGGALPTWLALRSAGAVPAGTDELEVMRVEAGRVRWPADMPTRMLIHELGLRDEVCSFEKGCYIGQEVINRIDVMGQVRRQLVGIRVADGPAGALTDGDWEVSVEAESVGRVTSPVRSPTFGDIALAVVRKPHDLPGAKVRIVSGARSLDAVVCQLPFGSEGR
jgi:folate-binding protein YgfZ